MVKEDKFTIKLPEKPVPVYGPDGKVIGMATNFKEKKDGIYADLTFDSGDSFPWRCATMMINKEGNILGVRLIESTKM